MNASGHCHAWHLNKQVPLNARFSAKLVPAQKLVARCSEVLRSEAAWVGTAQARLMAAALLRSTLAPFAFDRAVGSMLAAESCKG